MAVVQSGMKMRWDGEERRARISSRECSLLFRRSTRIRTYPDAGRGTEGWGVPRRDGLFGRSSSNAIFGVDVTDRLEVSTACCSRNTERFCVGDGGGTSPCQSDRHCLLVEVQVRFGGA